MIITCINCNKKFDIDSNLIPDMGRLLQCASCEHKWFFKNSINPIKDNNNDISFLDQNKSTNNAEISSSDQLMEKIEAFSE